MKTQKVSFKGYQNVGAKLVEDSNSIGYRIVAQLTNEGEGDLSQWQSILKRFPDSAKDNFIRIDEISDENAPFEDRVINKIKLNGKVVEFDEKNIPVFTKIASFLNKIFIDDLMAKTFNTPSGFPLKDEYVKSAQCLRNYNLNSPTSPETIEKIHRLGTVKDAAEDINYLIKNNMETYFSKEPVITKDLIRIPFDNYKNIGAKLAERKDVRYYSLVVQLSGENTKNLQEWKEILDEMQIPFEKNFIKIENLSLSGMAKQLNENKSNTIRINGRVLDLKNVTMLDQTSLKLITKIADVIKEINSKYALSKAYEQNIFKTDADYLNGGDIYKLHSINPDLSPNKASEEIEKIHDIDKINMSANKINNAIAEIMDEYFLAD